MRCIKVAFGLDESGNLTDEHYGDSEKFAIYNICEDGSIEFLEYRENKAKEYNEQRHGDPRKFKLVIEQLEDVDLLAGWIFGPNFLRIKKQSKKVAFYTRTRELKEAIERIVENFDKLWEEISNKKNE